MEGKRSSNSFIDTGHRKIHQPLIVDIKKEDIAATVFNFHTCKLCPYKTKSHLIMKNHEKRHQVSRISKVFKCRNTTDRYKCSNCEFKTSLVVNFNKHVEVSHKKALEIKVENNQNQSDDSNTMVFVGFNLMNDVSSLKSYSCENCNFKTYSQLVYINHFTKCPLNEFINCNSYFRRNNSHREFIQWHKFHSRSKFAEFGSFQCCMCAFKARRQSVLDGHMKVKHFSRRYYFNKRVKYRQKGRIVKLHLCDDCDYFTTKILLLRNHIISKHTNKEDIKWYQCHKCEYKTKWQTNLLSHKQCVHKVSRFSCEHCPYITRQRRLLETHILVSHPDDTWEKTKRVVKDNTKFRCQVCSFVSTKRIALLNHLKFKHPGFEDNEILKCQQCGYWAWTEDTLKQHKKKKHSSQKMYQCKDCNFECTGSRELRDHLEKHVKPKPSVKKKVLKCELCTFKTSEVLYLQDHILTMHVATQVVTCFECKICTYKTIKEGDLKEHVFEKHIDPQVTDWFYCEMCSYKHRLQDELKSHILDKHIL